MSILFDIYFIGFVYSNLITIGKIYDPYREKNFSHKEKIYRFALTFIWPSSAIYFIYLFLRCPWRD